MLLFFLVSVINIKMGSRLSVAGILLLLSLMNMVVSIVVEMKDIYLLR